MSPTQNQQFRDEATAALQQMQDFDVDTLVRGEDFGRLNFRDAIAPAQDLVDLYKRLTPIALQDFPDEQLNTLKAAAARDYGHFQTILNHDPAAGITPQVRDQNVSAIQGVYQKTFNELQPLISYSLHRATDFQQLDRDARAAVKAVEEQAAAALKEIAKVKKSADQTLATAQKAAAEYGVSQQAIHFRDEANGHDEKAKSWRTATIWLAVGLGVFAIASLWIHQLPGLNSQSGYQTVQVAVSKVLIFTVISYMLYLAARNFLSHKHNAIVNRHRQQALLTFEALVAAAKETTNKDVILTHASACIFAPQPTGYGTDGAAESPTAKSIVEIFSKQAGV